MNAPMEMERIGNGIGSGSRRRRLWDLPHKCHCPVIGVCFDAAELPGLLAKAGVAADKATAYEVHVHAVGECESRTPLTERLQRLLEQRYALAVRRFAAAKSAEALRELWLEGKAGPDIAGALWAAWTHARCDAALTQEIYADIHMLQHQVSNRARAERLELAELRADNARLKQELSLREGELTARLAQKNLELERAKARTDELESRYRGKESMTAALFARLARTRADDAGEDALHRALKRAETAERRCAELEQAMAQLRADLADARNVLPMGEATHACESAGAQPCLDEAALSDRCVLCVGGKNNLVDAYRGLVERCGGRFVHHDGGLEDNPHRLEASLAGADVVICQAGCVSHNAYWRVKDYCKRTGKRCVYLKSASVSSFARGIAQAAGARAPGH